MTLAAWTNYLFVWQLPLFGLFAAAWLIGGPYLPQRALVRHTEVPRSKRRMARCAQLNFFATGIGMLALLVITGFFFVISRKLGLRPVAFVGAAIGLPAMILMSWVVGLVLLAAPARSVLRLTFATTGPALALLVVVGAGAFVPAWFVRQAQIREDRCRYNLLEIHVALDMYGRRGEEASSLTALVEGGFTEAKYLTCPGNPERENGYLYVRARTEREQVSQRIRVCDRRGNHGSKRQVLFADGRVEVLSQEEFERLLSLPENSSLSKLVAAEP